MWPFNSKARQKRRKTEFDALVDRTVDERIGPTKDKIRNDTAQGVRRDILGQLSFVPISLRDIILGWHAKAVNRLHAAVLSWYETRSMHVVRELTEGRAAQEKSLMALDPASVLQSVADQYRRALIERVAEVSFANFTARSSEHAAAFAQALQQRANSLRGSIGTGDTPLPVGTRFFFENARGSKAYVVEQSPGMRMISYRGTKYRLAMPFVVFLVFIDRYGQFRSLHVSFRNSRLQKVGDELFRPALPNIDSFDGSVCFPHPYSSDNPAAIVEGAIQNFWGSDFNTDGRQNFLDTGERHSEVKDFGRWQRESAKDPTFVLSLDWLTWESHHGRTIVNVVNRILHDDQHETASSVESLITDAAASAAAATREMLVAELPRLRIEEAAATAIREKGLALWGESISALQCAFRQSADEIFRDLPEPSSVREDAEDLKRLLLHEAEQRLGWIGITTTPQAHVEKEGAT